MLHPAIGGQSRRPPLDIRVFVLLPQSCIALIPVLDNWLGLCPSSPPCGLPSLQFRSMPATLLVKVQRDSGGSLAGERGTGSQPKPLPLRSPLQLHAQPAPFPELPMILPCTAPAIGLSSPAWCQWPNATCAGLKSFAGSPKANISSTVYTPPIWGLWWRIVRSTLERTGLLPQLL